MPDRSLLLPLVLLAACTGGDDTGDTDLETAATCEIRFVEAEPADGATDAYYRGRLEFELTDADPTATVTVEGVSGTVSSRGSRGQVVVFTPDAPLAPSTPYTATLSFCGGSETLTFTTSEAGQPVTDPGALVGRVYAVPFRSGRIVEPDGAAGILRQYLTQTDLLQVDAATADSLTVTNGLAKDDTDPPEQDWCVPTATFDEADFSTAPAFTLGAEKVRMSLAGVVVELQQLQVSGAFLPDGASIVGGEVRYVMDMRPLASMVDASNPGSVCDAALQFGEACEACPDSGEPYCLRFHLDQLEGAWIEGLGLDPVAGANCADCEATLPAADAVCE